MEKYIENSDAFDYRLGGPVSVDYLLAVTPDHVQKLLEQRTGRAFIHLARQWSEERRAPVDDSTPIKRWSQTELTSVQAYIDSKDAELLTAEDQYLMAEFLFQRYLPPEDTPTEAKFRARMAELRAQIDENIANSKIPGWTEAQKLKPVPHDADFAEWMNKQLYPNTQNWVFIENEGALFRGPARGVPIEVWNGSKFGPYPPAKQSRPITWGNIITEDEAKKMMGDA